MVFTAGITEIRKYDWVNKQRRFEKLLKHII
jgi:hypothetical protein